MTLSRAVAIGLGGLALILVALTFESAILFVPGVALVLICAIAPAWVTLAARTAALSRTVHGDRVLEQQPLEATIEIAHGRLGLPGAEILDPLAGGPVPLRVSAVHVRGARVELRVVVRFDRRGRRTLWAPRMQLQDPLGLVALEREGEGAGQEVLVLPRIERPRSPVGYGAHHPRFDGGGRAAETLAAIEVDGLQPYRRGTPASRIHWLALARGQGLLERRLRAEGAVVPLVVLDARCPEPDERLDRAVRAAASLAHFLARRRGCELLLPGERRATQIERDLGAWPAVHARLALVEGGPTAPTPALTPRHQTVFYVAADARWGAPWPGAPSLHSGVLVLPSELAAGIRQPPIVEVAGCLGFAIGEVRAPRSDLRRRAA